MNAVTLPSHPSPNLITSAISRAGITGITAKQLAEVTRLPENEIHGQLDLLATTKKIARIGRGLWVLHKYAVLDPSEEKFRGPAWYFQKFESDFELKVGSHNGEIQFNPNERRPVHRWWPYVQGFAASFVEFACKRYRVGPGSVVLDPFCGSGTVPVTARMLGAQGIGIDMMPIASYVAEAKTEWGADPKRLLETAKKVVVAHRVPTNWTPFLKETKRQFAPPVLDSLLRLRASVWALREGPIKTLLKLAFANILIDSSNLKRAPCLGYTRKLGLTEDTPRNLFLTSARRIAEDLQSMKMRRQTWGPPADIRLGSSAVIRLPENTVDLAITSPPYVNGLDYVMNYKIDLAWMGFVNSYHELASLRASMVACDNIPKGTAATHAPSETVLSDDWLNYVTRTIDQNIQTKGSYRRDDMHAIVTKYFDDLVPVMKNVLFALKPGSRFVVVNGDSLIAGTYIPGDMIFARLAEKTGFIVEAFDIARNRRSGQRRGFLLRESVLTLRKPGPYMPPHLVKDQNVLDGFATES